VEIKNALFQIAKYDAQDGDYLGVCLNSKGEPWTYPTLEAAQRAAASFNSLGFADTRYEACASHHPADARKPTQQTPARRARKSQT
jgi:hypothetical protein